MENKNIQELRTLQDAGWQVDSSPAVRFNGGSEGTPHFASKALTAHVARKRGYCVDTEVEHERHGEIDVLLYSHDRLNIAVELENDPTDDDLQDKKERYVDSNAVIEDIIMINVGSLPANVLDMRDRICTELGLY